MVFDTSYLYYRAFFGVPSSLRAPDGTPVNAIRGLLDSITRLVEQYSPDRVACAWDDDWRPAWRTDLVPSYKAHRVEEEIPLGVDQEETPDELGVQVPLIREVLEAVGMPIVGAAEHEADDVAGTLATQHEGRCWVVTGDRDLFQLVDDDTRVIWVGQGVAKHAVVDSAWLQDKYGVLPERYVDFSVLRGDPSDGLPGVKGVGEKSAARLTDAFGSLEDLVRSALDGSGSIPPAIRRSIAESAEYILKAEVVVSVVRDLPLAAPPHLPLVPDARRVAALSERLGLAGPINRLVAACS
ncbi:5'-3' exonuclease [Tessaracoccus antarcticus]|uniref:5'-3' exonuclease n=2 Tax=Tessaracoccus antarcticus TaxID=2479848 RepID=A0A3M0G5K3_9ACTN|nr:5'-3' exonuclease [Tessaracoccus antarcticus]